MHCHADDSDSQVRLIKERAGSDNQCDYDCDVIITTTRETLRGGLTTLKKQICSRGDETQVTHPAPKRDWNGEITEPIRVLSGPQPRIIWCSGSGQGSWFFLRLPPAATVKADVLKDPQAAGQVERNFLSEQPLAPYAQSIVCIFATHRSDYTPEGDMRYPVDPMAGDRPYPNVPSRRQGSNHLCQGNVVTLVASGKSPSRFSGRRSIDSPI